MLGSPPSPQVILLSLKMSSTLNRFFFFAVKIHFTWFSLMKVFTYSVCFWYLMASSPVSRVRLNYWWRWLSLSLSFFLHEAELQNERTNKEEQRGRKKERRGKRQGRKDIKRRKKIQGEKGSTDHGDNRQKTKTKEEQKDKWNKRQQRRKENIRQSQHT